MTAPLRAAATACGLLCLAAVAQAQVAASTDFRLYGLADMSVGRFQTPGGSRFYGAESGSMSTSYLGFSGNEDLGGGLRARFALETFIRTDAGAQGRFDGDAFYARNAFVGLSGAFGTSQLGRNTTPLFVSTLLFNAFGDSFGFSPSIRHYFINPAPAGGRPQVVGDSGWNNSLLYSSPKFGNFSYNLALNAGEGSPNATGRNLSVNGFYATGRFAATAVWQRARNASSPLPSGFDKQDTAQVGASYDFGVAKLYAQYGQVRTASSDAAVASRSRISGIGAAVPVGDLGRVLVQYGYSRTSGNFAPATWKTATIGYDYSLSKNTDVYALYMHERTTAGLASVTPAVAGSGNSVAAGMRLRF